MKYNVTHVAGGIFQVRRVLLELQDSQALLVKSEFLDFRVFLDRLEGLVSQAHLDS